MCQLGLESSRKGIRIFETRDSALEWMEDPLLDSVVCDRAFPAGQALFSRGDSGDEIFFVRRGRVEVLLPLDGEKYHHLATFCQGDFFGEMAFLDREPRNAIVRAVIATDLYVLSRERFDRLAQANPALGGFVFERLAHAVSKRLRTADIELGMREAR
jgi:SulP family sulfate permease